ncbi:SdpI family protein [Corynebacterium kroppenstedtii]|jgi:putative membrane protein|nr:SdpI family protein [Corynebacterium kroppenstedtii]MDU7287160.1 SdpI family protein [Corynebacterium kroppenstedtii]
MLVPFAVIASVGLFAISGLCLTITKDATSGTISRNSAIGIRTPETKKSDDGWVGGHKAATPILKGAGIVTLVITAVLIISSFFGDRMTVLTITSAILGYSVAIGGICWAAVVANNAAKTINQKKANHA